MSYVIPPQISEGYFETGNVKLSASDFDWKDVSDNNLINEEGMKTTRIGKAKADGANITILLGYDTSEDLPFISFTRWAPASAAPCTCSFDFAEVQQ